MKFQQPLQNVNKIFRKCEILKTNDWKKSSIVCPLKRFL